MLAEANQNGQGNALGQVSSIKGRRLMGGKPKPPPNPVVNSAVADQSNSVTGAYSGGSQPTATGFSGIASAEDGNAINTGTVVSGNRKLQLASVQPSCAAFCAHSMLQVFSLQAASSCLIHQHVTPD